MSKILINDGIHPSGLILLKEAGFEVITDRIPQEELAERLVEFEAICVRSATLVNRDIIDNNPQLKVIGRGGVGLDNIDVSYANEKNIRVINTPSASSRSVGELAIAHLFTIARSLHQSNRSMPEDGDNNFKGLKKAYSKGFELFGKTLGIMGMGRIGQATAKIALGIGMKVIAADPMIKHVDLDLKIGEQIITHRINTIDLESLIENSDVLSLHIPFTGKAAIGAEEFSKMKDGIIILNASRGGTLDEDALLNALDSGKVAAAGLDVFENEPNPRMDLLQHPRISLTPHIGASTAEAQEKIGIELADQLIEILLGKTETVS
jgi:D-3-phosphoglycerate dehydrogenase